MHPKTYKNEAGQYVLYRSPLESSKYASDSFDVSDRSLWRREIERYRKSPEGVKLDELARIRGLVIAWEVFAFGRVSSSNKLRHPLFPQVYYRDTEKHFFRKYGILSVYDTHVAGTDKQVFE